MYRYSVDNAITYSSQDLVLFKESPFASFMERLSLENPNHGIPPDMDSSPPVDAVQRQDDIADTLRIEGREVALIDWDAPEPQRRADTLAAMRRGVDFVVNGQLALGPLSGSANLLMRTSGYSEFGDFLFVPCSTQEKTTLQAAFRLCFLADLLHSLQGQLPPQMLIIRGGSNVVPLQTEDHIFHFRAVKQRFMLAQREFRKHRMPDPAESSHFGRWSDCANELLKQRALAGDSSALPAMLAPEEQMQPVAAAAQAGGADEWFTSDTSLPGQDSREQSSDAGLMPQPQGFTTDPGRRFNKGINVTGTLADQAQSLDTSYAMSASQSLSQSASARSTVEVSPIEPSSTSATDPSALLTDLQFIGRDRGFNGSAPGGVDRRRPTVRSAPESRLIVPQGQDTHLPDVEASASAQCPVIADVPATGPGESMPVAPSWAQVQTHHQQSVTTPETGMPSTGERVESTDGESAPHSRGSGEFNVNQRSIVDRDDAPIPPRVSAAPAPTLKPDNSTPKLMQWDDRQDPFADALSETRFARTEDETEDEGPAVKPFSSSLITNSNLDD
jgi:hypothetical protein